MSDWFKDWFASEEYLSVYNHRDESDAQKFFDLIFDNIKIKSYAKVLDAACGAGRHSKLLAKRGYNVFAFDLSKTLLNIAANENNIVNYFNADIRNVPLKNNKLDLIINIFTSFGYFESDEENFKFIADAYKILNKEGYFIFDYLNSDFITKNLVPESERQFGNKIIKEKRKIENSRVHKDILISDGDKELNFFESVKLYDKDTLIENFSQFGFTIKNIFGNYDGDPFDFEKSDRIILICSK